MTGAVASDDQWRRVVHLVVADEAGQSRAGPLAGLAPADGVARKVQEDRIDAALTEWARPRVGELAERLQGVGVPAAVVATGKDLVEQDPQLAARDFCPVLTNPVAGPVRHEGVVARLSRTPPWMDRPAPGSASTRARRWPR